MRIISSKDNKDYYDGLTSSKDTLIYDRVFSTECYLEASEQCRELIRNKALGIFKRTYFQVGSSHWDQIELRFIVLMFCGKFYPLFLLESLSNGGKIYDKIYSTIDEVKSDILSYGHKTTISHYENAYFTQIEKFISNVPKFIKDINITCESPIVVISGYEYRGTEIVLSYERNHNNDLYICKNVNLKELNFQKVLGNYQAFQEIEMYISTYLVKDKMPINPISDKIKVASHGFDVKSSFRKDPK